MSQSGKGTCKGTCRHCHVNKANRARGLCWACSQKPEVRALYPAKAGHYVADRVATVGCGRLPAEPTDALPGSEAKILVMQERASRGELLFHPSDAKFGGVERDE